jgi:hypothetical protein
MAPYLFHLANLSSALVGITACGKLKTWIFVYQLLQNMPTKFY